MFVTEQKKLEEELIKNGVDYKDGKSLLNDYITKKRSYGPVRLAMLVQRHVL